MSLIAELTEIIENERRLLDLIQEELSNVRELYGDERKSIITEAEGDVSMEDLIPNDGCVVTITKSGFIKRTTVDEFKVQNRGGKGVIGSGQKNEDPVSLLKTCNAHDMLMFFMQNGRVYVQKAYEIPEGSRTSKGRNTINFLEMQKDEKVAAIIAIDDFTSDASLVLCTKKGVVKKTKISAYKNHRKGGIIGINVDEGDQVLQALQIDQEDQLLILSMKGKGLRFDSNQLRDQGRVTRGVRGIRLKEGDEVVKLLKVDDDRLLLIAGKNGLGIRTKFNSFLPRGGESEDETEVSPRKRGGQGVIAMNTESVCGALSVDPQSEILMITKGGQTVRCAVQNIRETSRGSKGVKLVNLSPKDALVGVSEVVELDEDSEDDVSEVIEKENELETTVNPDESVQS
jgi:DNA gyrase subunit A